MTMLEVKDLKKHFPIRSGILGRIVGWVKAVDGVDISIEENTVVALVGESGSGKTTTARCVLKLHEPTSGKILFMGEDVTKLKGKRLRRYRRNVQAVFQNPFLSLNPRMKVEDIVAEPLKTHTSMSKKEIIEAVKDLLTKVGLPKDVLRRYPYDLSGGQAQRVAIARAIALKPKLVVLDEPTSALDVSVQAQILNLLADLKEEMKLSYLLITHDLSVVRYISDYVYVMYLGRIVGAAPTEELFTNPKHPYAQALLSAVPEPDPRLRKLRKRIILPGEPPSAVNVPKGCRLHPRCPYAEERCRREEPELIDVGSDRLVRCWRVTP